ncbi:MAG: GIY-YIG nuclease family protein [Salinarimonas sp.]
MGDASDGRRRGRTLKLFLVDGSPSGLITAELGNWSGKAVVAPRTLLPDLLRRDEALRTGVYLLVGDDPELEGIQRVYVGETDAMRDRLRVHDRDERMEFFSRVCFLVSKDQNLTKAHGRYLESRLIKAIREAGRAALHNTNEPDFRGLPEPEVADMEGFLDEVQILLPALGFDLLQPQEANARTPQGVVTHGTAASEEIVFNLEIKDIAARAVQRGGEFVVLAGSTAAIKETPSAADHIKSKRQALRQAGVLVEVDGGKLLRFTRDHAFKTPSGAGMTVAGRSVRGPTEWVSSNGRTYAAWRDAQIAAAEGDMADEEAA